MRFVLLDRIMELTPGQSITAVKNLSLAEEYLADHFPGFPVMPGVLMLEALIQAGAWVVRTGESFANSVVVLKETRAVRYNNFVAPGMALQIEMKLKKQTERVWDFQGTGTVDGNSAVSARVILESFNLADRHPELANADEQQRQYWKSLLSQLQVKSPQVGS